MWTLSSYKQLVSIVFILTLAPVDCGKPAGHNLLMELLSIFN